MMQHLSSVQNIYINQRVNHARRVVSRQTGSTPFRIPLRSLSKTFWESTKTLKNIPYDL